MENRDARRLLGMTHWRSNTQQVVLAPKYWALKTRNEIANVWHPIRTNSYDARWGFHYD